MEEKNLEMQLEIHSQKLKKTLKKLEVTNEFFEDINVFFTQFEETKIEFNNEKDQILYNYLKKYVEVSSLNILGVTKLLESNINDIIKLKMDLQQ